MKQTPLQAALQAEAFRWFQSLGPVRPQEMVGLWRGVSRPSGHPLDGVLENLHWFGKRVHPDLRVDALLFEGEPGRLVPVDPKFLPARFLTRFGAFGRSVRARNLFSHLRPRLRARSTTASLKTSSGDDAPTAVMVYDRQPISDTFRRIDDHSIAGMMVLDRDPRRYFFELTRVEDRAAAETDGGPSLR